jgi:hypothetical protein
MQRYTGVRILRTMKARLVVSAMAGIVAMGIAAGSASVASAAEPWWNLTTLAVPEHFVPGGTGTLEVFASNVGDANVDGSSSPVKFTDKLPPGFTAVNVVPTAGIRNRAGEMQCTIGNSGSTVSCEYLEALLPPYEELEAAIEVHVATGVSGEVTNEFTVNGGGAPPASESSKLTVSAAPVPFGIASYSVKAEAEGGAADTQAGSHPFQLTTTMMLNQRSELEAPPALPKDLHFALPPGLIGNPTIMPQCQDTTFAQNFNFVNNCPPDTTVGVAVISLIEPSFLHYVTAPFPVFNLTPAKGEPARFGFSVFGVPIILNTAVRTGGDYGVTVSVENISQVPAFIGSRVTLWGVPADSRHDDARDWGCVGLFFPRKAFETFGAECLPTHNAQPAPFLTLPTQCGTPLTTSVTGDSWATLKQPEDYVGPVSYTLPETLDGCNHLAMPSEIQVSPDDANASTPTGMVVNVHAPQTATLGASGLAESSVKKIEVALPNGVTLNSGGAGGLQSCSLLHGREAGREALEAEGKISGIDLETAKPANCPQQSKIATVKVRTPLLPNALEGAVYLAKPDPLGALEPEDNPFDSLIAMYLVAEDPVSGTLVKLPMHVELNEATGQVVAIVENPELPFEDAELHFFGGSRAPLATPVLCGSYTTHATFSPWSEEAPVPSTATFDITNGVNGGPCPSDPRPFAPELNVGTTNIQAGAFTELRTTLGHPDPDQDLGGLQMKLPKGLMGTLSTVKLCPEPQAAEGTCGPESLIGHTTVTAGFGSTPAVVTRPGNVYITGGYHGAPYGLSIATPAEAGPFDLERGTPCDCVVVRAKVEVDPHTAQLTVTTDPLPQMIKGIPLNLQHVSVQIDRPGFTFNPTNCEKMAIEGSMVGSEGASTPISVPFQATNCAVLKFQPKFAVSTNGKTSKANGASLTANLSYPAAALGTQADIARVKVDLPKQLPSRLTTLQKACTNKQFELNPAGCPAESKIGFAKVTTPLLPVPLEGPAIFVSHGGEAFPSLTMVLQGYGVTVDLVGTTFISHAGITSTTFKTVPDVPFNTFTLTLPQGKYSALAANGNLCTSKLAMPTEFLAQNGAKINESTPISVSGCAKQKALTRAQKLARAMKACKKEESKSKRQKCEKTARTKYGPLNRKKNRRGAATPSRAR